MKMSETLKAWLEKGVREGKITLNDARFALPPKHKDTRCYECNGDGWDYGHRYDGDGEWKEPTLNLEEGGGWFWVVLECPENDMRIHWCYVCFECDGTGVENAK